MGQSVPRRHEERRLFEAALDLTPEERGAFLARECGSDAELRGVVENLLRLAQEPDTSTHVGRTPDPDGETVHVSGQRPDDSGWTEFMDQLRSRGPTYSRYTMRGEIARGGMGVIHRVYDLDVRRPLAMKVVLGTEGGGPTGDTPRVDDRTLGRFLEEAQVTGQLDHPGIVPVHDVGVDQGGRVFFTMKLVKGEDLREVFDKVHDPNDDSWNLTRVLHVLLRACEAMAFAHQKRVIHRDLKPGNVMVGRFGEVFVMDWGLARILGQHDHKDIRPRIPDTTSESLLRSERRDAAEETPDRVLVTMDGDVVGTPAYMPPEQAGGQLDWIGPASDIYAIGAMLYHLLAGHMPYVERGMNASARTVLGMVLTGPPKPLASVGRSLPPELISICETAMSRSIPARYRDMRSMADDLRAYLENRVVAAHRTGALAELRMWIVRNRATATALTAAILLACMGGVVIFRQALDRARVAERIRAENAMLQVRRDYEVAAPIAPESIPRLQQWLEAARRCALARDDCNAQLASLRERGRELPSTSADAERLESLQRIRPAFHQELTRLRDAAEPPAPGTDDAEFLRVVPALVDMWAAEIAKLRARIALETPWQFDDDGVAAEYARVRRLAEDMALLTAPELGLIARVESRLERARVAESLQDDPGWSEAITAIAAPTGPYAGLTIERQAGLVPLGPDHDSGLWEFWHVASGTRPERDETTGRLLFGDASGIVLVLVPGGEARLGVPPDLEDAELEFKKAERPDSLVPIEPFFISKFEVTQGQWLRLHGRHPSRFYAGYSGNGQPRIDWTHPVEQVDWTEARDAAHLWALALPTEAQWEYAARAANRFLYRGSDDPDSLLGDANELGAEADGYVTHAPAMAFSANPFGLHHMNGNVWEWCADPWAKNQDRRSAAFAPGDGLRAPSLYSERAVRGGSWHYHRKYLRATYRQPFQPNSRRDDLGFRTARRLEKGR